MKKDALAFGNLQRVKETLQGSLDENTTKMDRFLYELYEPWELLKEIGHKVKKHGPLSSFDKTIKELYLAIK